MNPELDKQLCEEFPKLFADRNKPMTETCMCWGFECNDGWFHIVYNLCRTLQEHIDQTTGMPQVVVDQVKEKFGTLCFYWHFEGPGGNDEKHFEYVFGAVDMAEHLSATTCEVCGCADPKKVGMTLKGWLKVICSDCIPADRIGLSGWKNLAQGRQKAKAKV